jgi:phosphatidylserine decarboxylase
MRIPLTKYGLPQVLVFPAVVLMLMVVGGMTLGGYLFWVAELVLSAVLVWLLAFFRDPEREVPSDKNILLSPADGAISEIDVVDEASVIGGRALRIGIFLNIFNVHINRTPCAVRIDKITYRKGRFKNAMNPESARVNESNDIAMTRLDTPAEKLLVRQISGAIARRIVCQAKPEQDFAGGERFGMIKFGSRTELYLPFREELKPLVKVGDKVKAGLTVFIRY